MIFPLAAILVQPLLFRQATVDISPPELLPLGGYTERHGKTMEAGGEPLYARCIEFEDDGVKVAIVSAEMLTIPESLYREVSARIPKDVRLFLQATHTHCAPDSQMLNDRMTFSIPGIATFRKRWLAWYADKIAGAVTTALIQPGSNLPILEAQTGVVHANRARRKGGLPDLTITALQRPGIPDGPAPVRIFVHFAAHPTIYDENRNQTSGDWPGLVAKSWGVTVLNGAIGDVSPAADGPTPEAKFKNFMDEITAWQDVQTLQVWSDQNDRFAWADQAIKLDKTMPHPTFAKTYGIPQKLAQSLAKTFAPSSDSVSAIRIGSLAIIGVPGEPTSILGNQIKAAGLKLGFKSVLVCSHVNGWMGYILDPKDYDRGGYEAELSFYGRNEGRKVVDAAISALRKLAK